MIYGNDHSSTRIMRVINNWKPRVSKHAFLKYIYRIYQVSNVSPQRDKKKKKKSRLKYLLILLLRILLRYIRNIEKRVPTTRFTRPLNSSPLNDIHVRTKGISKLAFVARTRKVVERLIHRGKYRRETINKID